MRASLMVTCLADALFPGVGEAAVRVLRELGVTVDFPPGQVCCGQPAYNSGYPDEARAAARAYLRAFADSEHVVSVSGSCAAMVRNQYPALFEGRPELGLAEDVALRTFEFSEFLVDVLRVSHLPVACRRRATFHHSCHTVRTLGVKRQPELLIGMVEGLDYVPLPRAEECCGFGGTFAVRLAAVSMSLVDDKVDSVLATRAELLMGLDMSCLMNIGGRLRRRGNHVVVKHLCEVLAEGWQA